MGRLSLNYTMPLPNAIAPGGSLLQAVFTACLYEKTILAFFAPFFYNVEKTAGGGGGRVRYGAAAGAEAGTAGVAANAAGNADAADAGA